MAPFFIFPAGTTAMTQQALNNTLALTLLHGATFSATLFDSVLAAYRDELRAALEPDEDDALLCLVVEGREVAIWLLETDGSEHANEAARQRLQQMWAESYSGNVRELIPGFVALLDQGMLAVGGVKWS